MFILILQMCTNGVTMFGTILESKSSLYKKWCNVKLEPPSKFGFSGHLGRCKNVYIRIKNVYKISLLYLFFELFNIVVLM